MTDRSTSQQTGNWTSTHYHKLDWRLLHHLEYTLSSQIQNLAQFSYVAKRRQWSWRDFWIPDETMGCCTVAMPSQWTSGHLKALLIACKSSTAPFVLACPPKARGFFSFHFLIWFLTTKLKLYSITQQSSYHPTILIPPNNPHTTQQSSYHPTILISPHCKGDCWVGTGSEPKI